MSYAIRNLREVEDSAPKYGFGDTQEAHFARHELGAERTGLSFHVVKPGQRQGFAHRHGEAEEIYVVVRGSGRMRLDDEVVEVGPMDAIRVAAPVARCFEAGDEGLDVLAFGTHHENDTEMITDQVWVAGA
jgi:uncharacterized cupin superfamily protein